jgi:predicted AlkP superfamily pyrophosphatase or phosphodiesterase
MGRGSRRLGRAARTRLFATLALLSSTVVANAERPVVIVLSWDGVRHDYLDRTALPALDRIQASGLRAERLIPVFPSNTFPNHVSLATGTYPDRHGIIDNVFRDRERGLYDYSAEADWLAAEPIWAAAERQGVRSAVFFWVGSETDWRGTGASYRKAPFDGDIGEAEKVDQILAWLDLPKGERPGLIMAWWHGADGVGHMKGPNHPDIAAQLLEQDGHLQRLLAGVDERERWPSTSLLVVSDHGMTEVTETVPIRESLEAAGIAAKVIPRSSTASVDLEDPADQDAAFAALNAIPGVKAYPEESIPEALRVRYPARTGDLMAITTPPRTFYEASWIQSAILWFGASFRDWTPGMHGYAPEHPDMGAILLGMGRGVPRGKRIGPVRSIDVAPTIARLLGIDPPTGSEGVAIAEFDPTSSASPDPDPDGRFRAGDLSVGVEGEIAAVHQLDLVQGRLRHPSVSAQSIVDRGVAGLQQQPSDQPQLGDRLLDAAGPQ